VLHFDKDVTFPANFSDTNFTITYTYANTVFTFTVDSIGGIAGQSRTDSVFTVYLHESKNNIPQTAWTPSVTITGLSGITPVTNVTTVDGAGPVIWSVSKDVKSLNDRSSDLVSVTFSEPIQASDGSAFKNKLSTDPSLVFYVWKQVGDSLVLDTILNGISEFYTVSSDGKTVSFYMKNGNDLTAQYYISLKPDSSLIIDQARTPNDPSKINQKVQVQVVTHTPNVLTVYPNPGVPSYKHPEALSVSYNADAVRWAHDDGGVALKFDVAISTDPSDKITGYLKIYDVIGNVVCEAGNNNTNLIPPSWQGGKTVQQYFIYWNGLNSRKTKAAPGVYSAILYLTKTSKVNGVSHEKLFQTIGIRR
jgi:hypothetical protein